MRAYAPAPTAPVRAPQAIPSIALRLAIYVAAKPTISRDWVGILRMRRGIKS